MVAEYVSIDIGYGEKMEPRVLHEPPPWILFSRIQESFHIIEIREQPLLVKLRSMILEVSDEEQRLAVLSIGGHVGTRKPKMGAIVQAFLECSLGMWKGFRPQHRERVLSGPFTDFGKFYGSSVNIFCLRLPFRHDAWCIGL